MARTFILGTRGSPLALAQAQMVRRALCTAHGWPESRVEIRTVKTSGDRIQDRPLSEVGGKALWTKELDRALLDGESDFSVHSMKDVESASHRPERLTIPAMLERADVRDRLIGAERVADLPDGATVGTRSPRRTAQLLRLRPDLHIVPIRGNVATRLAKLAAGEADATLLAAAGLDRLDMTVGHNIPVGEMLPAPSQAAIGIECRRDDADVIDILSAIDHQPTHQAVALERAFTDALGGNCHSPVAALAFADAQGFRLKCQILSSDGRDAVTAEEKVAPDDYATAAALARRLLAEAPISIQSLFEAS